MQPLPPLHNHMLWIAPGARLTVCLLRLPWPSSADASSRNVGWVRGGEGVTYKCKGGTGAKDYSVSFSLRFPHGPSDLCFVAYSYPFTYTDLNMYLHDLVHHPQRRYSCSPGYTPHERVIGLHCSPIWYCGWPSV